MACLWNTPEERYELMKDMIHEFVKGLRRLEGDNLLRVIVFGSVARMEENDDSDIDIFVLLRDYDYLKKHAIYDLAFAVEVDVANHNVIISPFVVGLDDYERNKKREMIFYNIADEGAVVYDAEG